MIYVPNRRKAFRGDVLGYTAFYRFEDNGNDETGSNNAAMSSVTYSDTDWPANLGKYAIFDGSDSYGQVADSAGVTDVKSCCGWIYLNGWGETGAGRIFDKNTNKTFFAVENTARIAFGKTFSGSIAQWVSDNTSISLSTRTHVGYSYPMDGSTSSDAKLYINGVSVNVTEATAPSGTFVSDTGADMYLGNREDTARTFDGRVDNLRFYNRVLSDAEFLAIYNFEN